MKIVLIITLLFSFCISIAAQESVDNKTLELSRKVDELFSSMDFSNAPGAAITIIKDGKVVYRKGFGIANLEYDIPIEPSTVFEVGSVTKQFTGMALAILASEGKLSLDDDIRKYLSQVPNFGKKISIRHLLLHTSGLPDYFGLLGICGTQINDRISTQDVLEIVYRLKDLNFEPGTRSVYSNTGYVVAAAIVEKVTEEPFGEWMKENIFDSLGMKSTFIKSESDPIIENRAYSYSGNKKNGYRNIVSNSSAIGPSNLLTTADDLAKWLLNFEDSKISPKRAFSMLTTSGSLNNGEDLEYGLGLNVYDYRGLKRIGHGGGTAGFRSRLAYFPEHGFGVALWGNSVTFNDSQTMNKVIEIYLKDYLEPSENHENTPEIDVAEIDPKIFDEYAGDYKLEDGTIISFGRYYSRYFATKLGQSYMEIYPESKTSFIDRNKNTRITFLSENGKANGQITVLEKGVELNGQRVVQPSVDALMKYAGSYYCDVVNTVWEIVGDGEKLTIKHVRLSNLPPLTYLDDDLFSAGYIIRFSRNEVGKIDGFHLSSSRIKNIRFTRIN